MSLQPEDAWNLRVLHSTREWLELLLAKALDPDFGLFKVDARSTGSLKINPTSSAIPNYLDYFKFLGRIHGISMVHGLLIDPRLVPLFYPLVGPQSEKGDTQSTINNAVKDSLATW